MSNLYQVSFSRTLNWTSNFLTLDMTLDIQFSTGHKLDIQFSIRHNHAFYKLDIKFFPAHKTGYPVGSR